MSLPNFMCIGASKSGTTTLYDILRQHPDIFIPSYKEPHFFDSPIVFERGVDWYENTYFRNVKNRKCIGDFTPSYLFEGKAPQRILRALGKDVKFIMKKYVLINGKIKKFKKKITVSADKSLSIRWVLMAAQAVGKSIAYNLLNSEDVNNALIAVKKIGVKVIKKKNLCQINGVGLNGFSLKNNTIIDAGNSGTLARLIIGVLAKSNKTII